MTVVDPDTGEVEHPQDDPAVLDAAASELNNATVALELVDYNALRDGQLKTVLRAKRELRKVTSELRTHQHAREGQSGGGTQ